ncbi:hypothetical protein M6B38_220730 [Iris pallida]|uniref:Uncharacterized protein n=1 Tax=Iris pallida TaxID=29817 RepID=A0AAX6DYT8_IRIPA|nr:hypothetical protein M6B38_220730 [Iris pallida]
MGFPDISGSSVDWKLISGGLEIFWWIYLRDYYWVGIIAGFLWRISQFWVCPEIEEVLPKFLQKTIFN